VAFTAQPLNDKSLNELAALSELLQKVGFSLETTRKGNPSLGLEYDYITIKLDKEKYNEVVTRHAGRKADFEEKYDKYGKCTVAELKEMLMTMSKTNIAQELGCSRMTLYRILKNIEERNPAGDTSIWHYTS
jgi:DNA invertase Pin-like site-specific DNA recombinase